MASKAKTGFIGANIGALVGGPTGAVIGGGIGSLFGKKKKKKDPWEWYKRHPEEIPGALAKDRDPKKYARNRYMLDLLDQYEQATETANAENQRRYQQLLQESGKLEQLYRTQKYVAPDFDAYDYGAAAKKEVEQERRYGQAEALSALNRQGLGGSTVVGSITQQAHDVAGRSKAAIEAEVRKYRAQQRDVGRRERMGFESEKLAQIASARTGKMGIIERKTDVGPDPQFFSQMFQFAAGRPGMFRQPTARRRVKLEQIYQKYGNQSATSGE